MTWGIAVRSPRRIVSIDESKCDGCGTCLPACAEGAIRVVAGKARLVSDALCDGLGACLAECPRGAITILEREAEVFSEEAVHRARGEGRAAAPLAEGCPSARWREGAPAQWPVQLRLISPSAPFLRGRDLLLTADCVPVAHPGFRGALGSPHAVALACPKFDDPETALARLTQIVGRSGISGVSVVRMEVPCCAGLTRLARLTIAAAASPVPLRERTVATAGAKRR